MKKLFTFVVGLAMVLVSAGAFAQDTLTKGSIGGTVVDQNGGAIAGASVTVSGVYGDRTATADSNGVFKVENLTPGVYSVKASGTGFKTTEVTRVEVLVGKESTLSVKLEPGDVSATVTVTGANAVDSSSTATSSNLNDQLYSTIPVQRAVSSLFYLAPGTTDSLGGGRDNPSISGGSALDNLYVADGVNITDSAFGGIGTFSRSYGALGTGINTSFIKEVQVKTAGFEPQYGQSQGGIVNIITQSGGNEFHGAVYGFASPKSFEKTRVQPDEPNRVNKAGKILHDEGYDMGVDLSGPIMKEKLFFFGSFNPSVRRQIVRGAERNAQELANNTSTDFGLRTLRGLEFANRTRTFNYAGKIEWMANPNHQVTFSIFGDPSKTNLSSFRTLVTSNTTADSILDYGTRNMSIRYNGSLTPTLTLNASVGFGKSRFNETGFASLNQIADRRGSDAGVIFGLTGRNPEWGNFNGEGLGFYEPTNSRTRRFEMSLAKTHTLWGQHSASIGYTFQRGLYDGSRLRSGPTRTIPNTATNGAAAGQTTSIQFRLRFRTACAGCPTYPVRLDNGTIAQIPVRLQVYRAEFGVPDFTTYSNYHAAYAQDTWRFNKYITGLFGIRWEQERLVGSPGAISKKRIGYTFTDQWAPRMGVTVDPLGRGKTKAFYNYGRFFEYIPLDMAERSLSSEQDWIGATFAPAGTPGLPATLDQYGQVIPIIDAAHQLTGPTTISTSDPSNPITPGTKLGFTDEHTIGFEQQLPGNFTFSARWIKRDAKRIVEDAASVSPEASLACDVATGGTHCITQVYFIGNIGPRLDAAVNLVPFQYPTGGAFPAGCALFMGLPRYNFDGPNNQSVCFAQTGINPLTDEEINTPDGKSDGFPNAIRQYRALEIEINRRFSNGWQGFFNWRIATLRGNFEGHLRNDNGQTDPAISSLFDFTTGNMNLLGDQFAVGPLNTDRHHIVNVFGSYSFNKDRGFKTLNGLNLGFNVHMESGLPVSEFLAHPVYLNAGEIPVGGRGKLGRTPTYTRWDAHVDYAWGVTENTKVKFVADFFNIFNSTKLRFPTQFKELDLQATNPDFLKGASFYNPFNLRLGIRFEF